MTTEEKLDLILQKVDGLEQEMGSMEQRLNGRMDALEERLTRVQVTLENEMNKKIDVIGEGHEFEAGSGTLPHENRWGIFFAFYMQRWDFFEQPQNFSFA